METPLSIRPQGHLLAESLEVLRLESGVLGRLDLRAPWGIQFNGPEGWFHLLGVPGLVELRGTSPGLSASAGDLVVVLPGNEHCLRSDTNAPVVSVRDLPAPFRCDTVDWPPCARASSGFVDSGFFLLEGFERTPLSVSLPPLIHIKSTGGRPAAFVEYVLRLAMQEVAGAEPAAPLIIDRLVRILLIKVVQSCISTVEGQEPNWLRAVGDPGVGLALAIMHEQPEEPWTVAALAGRVAMSRSAFSAKFTALVGKPPLEYLSEWRMQKAASLLRSTRDEIKEVALKVGYESTSAFSRAFARWAGTPPGTYRDGVRLKGTEASAQTNRPAW